MCNCSAHFLAGKEIYRGEGSAADEQAVAEVYLNTAQAAAESCGKRAI